MGVVQRNSRGFRGEMGIMQRLEIGISPGEWVFQIQVLNHAIFFLK